MNERIIEWWYENKGKGHTLKIILHKGLPDFLVDYEDTDASEFEGYHVTAHKYECINSLDDIFDHATTRGHDTVWLKSLEKGGKDE